MLSRPLARCRKWGSREHASDNDYRFRDWDEAFRANHLCNRRHRNARVTSSKKRILGLSSHTEWTKVQHPWTTQKNAALFYRSVQSRLPDTRCRYRNFFAIFPEPMVPGQFCKCQNYGWTLYFRSLSYHVVARAQRDGQWLWQVARVIRQLSKVQKFHHFLVSISVHRRVGSRQQG